MKSELKKDLKQLFESWSGEQSQRIEPLPAHGSAREYYRISNGSRTAIGTFNEDRAENIAFLEFSRHFYKAGLAVPEIYIDDLDKNIYLEQDLGDVTLFSFLSEEREKAGFSDKIINAYEDVVKALPQFQIKAANDLNYNLCYPRHSFDKQSMMWDLNYFKYYFLKLAKIPFDEQKLEDDFKKFTRFLLSTERDYFLYRDFQSRNVMLLGGKPYFIDYQGGRKGALQYDIASLLYDAKADIPQEVRLHLLETYMTVLKSMINFDRESFLEFYYGYVFIRIMQALGAYGFRGFYERKSHFLKSVPYAIRNLEILLHTVKLPVELPALTDAWSRLIRSTYLRQLGDADLRLIARIQSFSYKRGIPRDDKGHGGGFVLDCRALPNPGRYPEYVNFTGNDEDVIAFLKKEEDVSLFLNYVFEIVDQAVMNYQKRNFTDLMIAFGCTGGQHRSVYCANQLAMYLREKHKIDVEVRHRELEMIET
ncbi:MAG: phosphotransferase [Calditrichia bacterium]|nr:phosphotransferase [Calditrichia bacterium]